MKDNISSNFDNPYVREIICVKTFFTSQVKGYEREPSHFLKFHHSTICCATDSKYCVHLLLPRYAENCGLL